MKPMQNYKIAVKPTSLYFHPYKSVIFRDNDDYIFGMNLIALVTGLILIWFPDRLRDLQIFQKR